MKILLQRKWKTQNSTIGEIYVNGDYECYSLEDVERESKIYGKTAIPKGNYEIIVSFSNRFQTPLPLLLNVPDFKGVRIHPGNTANDTEGCILVGSRKMEDKILNSRVAFNDLFRKIQTVHKKEKIWLTIE